MTKEYRVAGIDRIYLSRSAAIDFAKLSDASNAAIMERDVSPWRSLSPESEIVVELCRLRSMTSESLAKELGVMLTWSGNPYEMDTAILFHLIQKHGASNVQSAVHELLGTTEKGQTR